MSSPAIIGVLLSVASLNTLVVGDPLTVLTLDSAIPKTETNDYFDPWTVELFKTKKNTIFTIDMPTKKELSPTMQVLINYQLEGEEPGEFQISLCDALEIASVRSMLDASGKPSETFPKACPFSPGDWTLFKMDFPTDLIPSNFPDGPFSASFKFLEEGQSPFVQIDCKGSLSHDSPSLGR